MITIIGDVHGKFDEYFNIVKNKEYSLCLGDFGFESTWNKLHYSGLNPNKHKICKGNHDQYSFESQFNLGDYGSFSLDKKDIFFIRGGLSIDRVYRVGEELSGGKKTWWSQEELNLYQMIDCIDLYKKTKPEIVISHVPPQRFIEEIHGNKDNGILQKFKFHEGFCENTSLLCDELLDYHKPKIWLSGHHHRNYEKVIGGRSAKMQFISLAELATFELE